MAYPQLDKNAVVTVRSASKKRTLEFGSLWVQTTNNGNVTMFAYATSDQW
jgi:hypothetical protein